MLRARPSCRKREWRLTVGTRPIPPQRCRAPLRPAREAVRTAVGQTRAHVMQQQVRVGADRLLAERRDVAVTRLQLEAVACRAAEVGERALTRRGALGSDRTASRDGERARVEGHAAELLSVDLRPPAARRGLAGALAVGAVLRGEDRGRDADVAVEGAGVLLLDGRHVALPAEAPQDERPRAHVDDAVGPARDAVAVGVPRIGMFGDRLLGHGLQQAHAEDRGSDARSDPHALGQRA